VGGKQLETTSTNGFDVGGYSLLRRCVMYDSNFNMRGSFYEESKERIEISKKVAKKRVCPRCGFTTVTTIKKCLRCGGKLSYDSNKS
jgi:ribosomal protein L40E